MGDLELIKRDFMSLVDFDENNLTEDMKRNLLKATIENFYDYLKEKLGKLA